MNKTTSKLEFRGNGGDRKVYKVRAIYNSTVYVKEL